jgi:hypothetical protein
MNGRTLDSWCIESIRPRRRLMSPALARVHYINCASIPKTLDDESRFGRWDSLFYASSRVERSSSGQQRTTAYFRRRLTGPTLFRLGQPVRTRPRRRLCGISHGLLPIRADRGEACDFGAGGLGSLLDTVMHFDRILCSHSLALHGSFACFTPKSAKLRSQSVLVCLRKPLRHAPSARLGTTC